MRRPDLVFFFVVFILGCLGSKSQEEAKTKVHIVYLGRKQHKDPNVLTDYHHDMLANVVGSKEIAMKLMVSNYKHGLSGFAAKLTDAQAQKLSELPGVLRVIPNTFLQPQTTRSWDYLGLSSSTPTNLLHKGNKGDGIVIGVIDTGIWPESKSFNDEGLGPIPSRWKGSCVSGDRFNATLNCNNKLIGAKWYIDGLRATLGQQLNFSGNYLSARDAMGHGTHVASTALGSPVGNISYKGLASGTVRGGAPAARLAVYKVCWSLIHCTAVDVLAAFDDAIHDGVDLLSVSLGHPVPIFPEYDIHNPIAIGSFHAVASGITVVAAAGNDGSIAQSVINTTPWILDVAASTMDRMFPTPITLGNNQTILGQAFFSGEESGFVGLFYPVVEDTDPETLGICESLSLNRSLVAGKVVLCFSSSQSLYDIMGISLKVVEAGGVGLIVVRNPSDVMIPCGDGFPCIEIDYEAGTKILSYIRSAREIMNTERNHPYRPPIVKLSKSKTYIGMHVSAKVAYFSSRGPNSLAPEILKPDITAPGASILAATSPHDPLNDNGFAINTGTSMATPHVSGIVALLKSLHPDWSPAALKSALITTAHDTDPFGFPIFAEGSPRKIANPFDMGGGIVNANGAADPGLVYDMNMDDYLEYLCAMNYSNFDISRLIEKTRVCPPSRASLVNVNLPSITIPNLRKSTTISRTVTNVGSMNSTYRAIIVPPEGTNVIAKPNVLVFNSTTKKLHFTVTIYLRRQMNGEFYFGRLTWVDGVHSVRSPISVRAEFIPSFAEFS